MSIYLGENKIADNTCSRNIGEIVASTLPITDAGLHLLDGSLISSTGSYAKFVNYIAGLYNQTVPTQVTYYAWFNSRNGVVYTLSTTPSVGDHYFNYYNGEMIDPYIEGSPYPYYVTSVNSNSIGVDGEDAYQYTRDSSIDITLTTQTPPPYFCSESDWQSSVSTYGVCGKFVYDSVNNTVRLPKITGFTEGIIDPTTLGDLTTAGLPNITSSMGLNGSYRAEWWSDTGFSGALYPSNRGGESGHFIGATSANDGQYDTINFDASLSNSIYGNSSTVQPQSIKVLYYIVIASSITNELNLDVADMADKDFSNITSTGTSLASGWSMPSSRYIDLTLGASGATYTAPANGFVTISKSTNDTNQYLFIHGNVWTQGSTNSTGFSLEIFCPVTKGEQFQIAYNAGGAVNMFRFVYAEGEN